MKYTGSLHEEKSNGVTVIFMDTTNTDDVLVAFCFSVGLADEIDSNGLSLLLSEILYNRIRIKLDSEDSLRGAIVKHVYGHDGSVYYVYSKLNNIEKLLECIGNVFSDFSIARDDIELSKRIAVEKLINEETVDKKQVRKESIRALFWHSKYGSSVNKKDIEELTLEQIQLFKDKYCRNNRLKILCAGNVKRKIVLSNVSKYFQNLDEAEFDRLIEPTHHNSSVKLTRVSSQIDVPVVEMYWSIPCYRLDKDKALSSELLINYLEQELVDRLVKRMKVVSDLQITYDVWRYQHGEMRLTATIPVNSDVNFAILALTTEITSIVNEDITNGRLENIRHHLLRVLPKSGVPVLEAIHWFAPKILSCIDAKTLTSFNKTVKNAKLDVVYKYAIPIFKNGPSVISVIKPNGEKL